MADSKSSETPVSADLFPSVPSTIQGQQETQTPLIATSNEDITCSSPLNPTVEDVPATPAATTSTEAPTTPIPPSTPFSPLEGDANIPRRCSSVGPLPSGVATPFSPLEGNADRCERTVPAASPYLPATPLMERVSLKSDLYAAFKGASRVPAARSSDPRIQFYKPASPHKPQYHRSPEPRAESNKSGLFKSSRRARSEPTLISHPVGPDQIFAPSHYTPQGILLPNYPSNWTIIHAYDDSNVYTGTSAYPPGYPRGSNDFDFFPALDDQGLREHSRWTKGVQSWYASGYESGYGVGRDDGYNEGYEDAIDDLKSLDIADELDEDDDDDVSTRMPSELDYDDYHGYSDDKIPLYYTPRRSRRGSYIPSSKLDKTDKDSLRTSSYRPQSSLASTTDDVSTTFTMPGSLSVPSVIDSSKDGEGDIGRVIITSRHARGRRQHTLYGEDHKADFHSDYAPSTEYDDYEGYGDDNIPLYRVSKRSRRSSYISAVHSHISKPFEMEASKTQERARFGGPYRAYRQAWDNYVYFCGCGICYKVLVLTAGDCDRIFGPDFRAMEFEWEKELLQKRLDMNSVKPKDANYCFITGQPCRWW
ncbi:hypothetical protein G7Y89_g10754 [Cudoniella acicularis]|uniref:Uncharacterized protein n=1 Tax=Cudoniella acicularis TaxID=354080 RepID=A0A8H4RC61_9HELO|nr:hypothetical protein G7Y89_g10754 [Cudoniella acicularis]